MVAFSKCILFYLFVHETDSYMSNNNILSNICHYVATLFFNCQQGTLKISLPARITIASKNKDRQQELTYLFFNREMRFLMDFLILGVHIKKKFSSFHIEDKVFKRKKSEIPSLF